MNKNKLFSMFLLFNLLNISKNTYASGRLTRIKQAEQSNIMEEMANKRNKLAHLAEKNEEKEFNMLLTEVYRDKSTTFFFAREIAKPLAEQALDFLERSYQTRMSNPNYSQKYLNAGTIIISNPLIRSIVKKLKYYPKENWGTYNDAANTPRVARFFDYAIEENLPDPVLFLLFKNEYFPGTITGEEKAKTFRNIEEEQQRRREMQEMRREIRGKEFAFNLLKYSAHR